MRYKFVPLQLGMQLAFLVMCIFCVTGCVQKRSPKEEPAVGDEWFKTANDQFETKHRLRTADANGWKGELWLWGSLLTGSRGVTVCIRLTPDDQKIKVLPPVETALTISKKAREGDVRRAGQEVVWQECARMARRKERSYEDGKWGHTFEFPPKYPCWEASIDDAFKSDIRYAGARRFEPGEYLLAAKTVLGDNAELRFGNIAIEMQKGFQPAVEQKGMPEREVPIPLK